MKFPNIRPIPLMGMVMDTLTVPTDMAMGFTAIGPVLCRANQSATFSIRSDSLTL